VPVLLLAYLFLGLYYNMSIWFKLTNKTYYGTIITLIGTSITIAGNFILRPVAGYMGSSIAALLCYFTMAIVCYFTGQRHFPVPYTMAKDMGYIIVTYCITIAVASISFADLWINLGFDLLVIIIFCGTIFLIERKSLLKALA